MGQSLNDDIFIFDFDFNEDILLLEFDKFMENSKPYTDEIVSLDYYQVARGSFPYADKLNEYFGINASPRFYRQEANTTIPEHVDTGTLCALNFILDCNSPAPVTYGDRDYYYRVALLNVTKPHKIVNGKRDRILFKMSIFDETFEEVREKIKNVRGY